MSRELLQRAFEELDYLHKNHGITCAGILHDLKEELAKPDPEPVAWQNKLKPSEFYEYEQLDPLWYDEFTPLYASPPHNAIN